MEWDHHKTGVWSEDTIQIMDKIHTIGHQMRQHFHKAAQKEGITRSQRSLLKALMHKGPQCIQDLSTLLDLSNSTVSGIVDRLEEKGIVERRRDEGDRRSVYVHVTPGQKDRLYKMHNEFDKHIEAFFLSLSAEEKRTLHAIIEKFECTMDNMMGDADE